MKKFIIYNAQFIIFIFCLLFYILHSTFYIPSATALDSTPSTSIQAKLEELKQEIASKAALLKTEVNLKLQNKAFIGTIKLKSASSITLASLSGSKIISINQDTVYGSQIKKTKYSYKNLAEEDYIAALGDIDDTGVLTAKKIILLPKPNDKKKLILWGQVISISNKLVTIKDNLAKNYAVIIKDQAALNNLKLNDSIITTGYLNDNQILESTFAYIATSSAQIKSATPSGQKISR